MPDYEIVMLLGLWFLLVFVKRVKMKKGDVEIVLFLAVLSGFIVVDILELYQIDGEILLAALYIGFAITLLFFNVRDLRGKNQDLEKLKALKKEHKGLTTSYESLRKRFIATIDLMKDGLVFRSDDGEMFATDYFIEMIGIKTNELSQENYEKNIHPDDINGYLNTMKKLKRKQPDYEITYRFKKGNKYVWVKEKGTMIFYEDRTMVISVGHSIDIKLHPDTEVDMLNSLRFDQAFLEYLQSLNRLKNPYYLVFFELSNIPAINERYGRDIGDLMMGEFLNKLRYNFVKDEQSIFRLTGIRFAMVMKDDRKYQILDRALKHGGELLNFEMAFGNVRQSVYPYFGIQQITVFEEPLDEVVSRTNKALEIAISDDTHENYFIIK